MQQAVDKRSIKDIDSGEQISIPSRDISEPTFHHGQGGVRNRVLPGNKEFVSGDKIQRPESGGGSGSGKGTPLIRVKGRMNLFSKSPRKNF